MLLSLEMINLDSRTFCQGIIRSGLSWVASTWFAWRLMVTVRSCQFLLHRQLPANICMGPTTVVHWKQKYAFARPSKPQHMGRTLKHSREGELKPQDAMHRDNCCPSTCHWKKDRNYTRNVTLSDTRFGAVRTFFHHQSFSREWIRKSFLIRSDLHTIMCVL